MTQPTPGRRYCHHEQDQINSDGVCCDCGAFVGIVDWAALAGMREREALLRRCCDKCQADNTGMVVLCHLHAQAQAMRAALEKAARRLDDAAALMTDNEDARVCREMADEARVPLRAIEGA